MGQTRPSERFRFMSAQAPQAEFQGAQHDVAEVPILLQKNRHFHLVSETSLTRPVDAC